MDQTEIIVYLLPIVFMVHDFEEIITFSTWFDRNGRWLESRFPFLRKPVGYFQQLPVPAFALAVLEEFLLISLVTLHALVFQWFYAWLALFTAFAFHIGLHMIQWAIIRRYTPAIITSFLSLPYVMLGSEHILSWFSPNEIILCFAAGLFTASVNLFLIHKLITKSKFTQR